MEDLNLRSPPSKGGDHSKLVQCPNYRYSLGGGIRTHGLLLPKQAFYQAELHPDTTQVIHDQETILA